MKLWLDDQRDPTDPFWQREKSAEGDEVWVKTAWEAINYLKLGQVTQISFDHDLGHKSNGTGTDVAEWIERAAHDNTIPRLRWFLHSDNYEGRRFIVMAMEKAEKFWTGHGL